LSTEPIGIRWVSWSRLLWGLSRLKLRALPTHPGLSSVYDTGLVASG
jgi:hypothetical protein